MSKSNSLVQRLTDAASRHDHGARPELVALLREAADAIRAHLPEQGEAVAREYTDGRWHHGNGYLCMGTLRVARAELAARAMQGIMADGMYRTEGPQYVAELAVKYADALIAELNKPATNGEGE